ncbi:hypothetical protein Vadar_018419 [Vaccinium darrowii]|uniref:Uncharacterized protein n=1 Tax=Vaccinium darrowii TaxID=229202 RepID=A0ACB7YNY1_9ERIC|nr:hypothetical protein Vadar_018419 [Vaccinium darrowii]
MDTVYVRIRHYGFTLFGVWINSLVGLGFREEMEGILRRKQFFQPLTNSEIGLVVFGGDMYEKYHYPYRRDEKERKANCSDMVNVHSSWWFSKKLLNVWVIFTSVAIWHDLERKLLSWAWLTCVFFVPEMIVKSAATSFSEYLGVEFAIKSLGDSLGNNGKSKPQIVVQLGSIGDFLMVRSAFGEFVFRELSALAGAITITCLMVNWLISRFLRKVGSCSYPSPLLGEIDLLEANMLLTFFPGLPTAQCGFEPNFCGSPSTSLVNALTMWV